MRNCDFNCDDCHRNICIYGGQDADLDDEDLEALKKLLDLTLKALFNPKNYIDVED